MEHFLRLRQWRLSKYWRVGYIGIAALLVLCRVSAEHHLPYVSATAYDDESIVVHRVEKELSITVRYTDQDGQVREYTTRHEKERVFNPPVVVDSIQSLMEDVFGSPTATASSRGEPLCFGGAVWDEWERWRYCLRWRPQAVSWNEFVYE